MKTSQKRWVSIQKQSEFQNKNRKTHKKSITNSGKIIMVFTILDNFDNQQKITT